MKRAAHFLLTGALMIVSLSLSGKSVVAQEPLDGPHRPFKDERIYMKDVTTPPRYEAMVFVGYDNASDRYVRTKRESGRPSRRTLCDGCSRSFVSSANVWPEGGILLTRLARARPIPNQRSHASRHSRLTSPPPAASR